MRAVGFNVPPAGREGIVLCSACGDLPAERHGQSSEKLNWSIKKVA